MSTVTDFARAPGAVEEPKPSRRPRIFRGGAGTTTAGTTTPKAGTTLKAAAHRTANILSTVMVVVAVAAFLLLAVGPRVLHYQTSTMLTGSMAPLINPGDVVVTAPAPVSAIRVGDIITYHIPVEDHRVETHRVVEILTNEEGTTAVRTKGDANNGADPWRATLQGDTVHRHILTVPSVGQAIRMLREPVVLNTLMYGAPAVLVIGLLASIWRRNAESASGE
ncbi:signal peptidase [Arthrobacter pascens]|uniref:signal peptidase I n=1 Tax=Arthrobacter pascens TaxID=1677 RepID=UPI002793DFFD|nr:signal peptidase I [Arthrobacter pascens]MDQ0677334.1 signal peptidase [Arthrobacter pascens]